MFHAHFCINGYTTFEKDEKVEPNTTMTAKDA